MITATGGTLANISKHLKLLAKAGMVGRPDLLDEEQTCGLVRQLYESIYGFYLKLPGDVRVHPAHGAGSPCGAKALSCTLGQ